MATSAKAPGSPGRAKQQDTTPQVPKNDKGGVLVTEEELAAAFEFFDVDESGVITLQNLKTRLGAFYRRMPMREYRFLMNNENEITLDDLRELLLGNEITNFDPVAEAFKAYDPEDTGFVSPDVLRDIFENLGFGELDDEDMQILVDTADVDGDGRISLADFRNMLDFEQERALGAAGGGGGGAGGGGGVGGGGGIGGGGDWADGAGEGEEDEEEGGN